jgi:hypothetical protein
MADLKLKDLRYLVAVADTRHFGQAAARCFVSQPTLSAQLKKLEEYLGVQLIERHPRRIAMTEAGGQVVARARRIIEASDEIVALAELQRDPLAGRLRVALLPTIGPYLLPLVAARIRRKLPRIELLLYEYQTGTMLEHLQAGDVDLGILALPVPADGLVERPNSTRSPAANRSRPRISMVRRCCCSKTAIACVIRRWKSAPARSCTKSRTFAPPPSKPCGRWSHQAAASRCCPCWRAAAPMAMRVAL